MKNIKKAAKRFVVKYGASIATFAFAFVAISANTSCGFPYYESEEPNGIERFKKFTN